METPPRRTTPTDITPHSVCIPALLIAGANAYRLWNEHWEHKAHEPPPEERPEYPYQNLRTKNFFWGDGDKVSAYLVSLLALFGELAAVSVNVVVLWSSLSGWGEGQADMHTWCRRFSGTTRSTITRRPMSRLVDLIQRQFVVGGAKGG